MGSLRQGRGIDDVEAAPLLIGQVYKNRSFLPEAALVGANPESRPYNELRFDLRTKLDAWVLDRPLEAWGPQYWGMAHGNDAGAGTSTANRRFNPGSRSMMLATSPPTGLAADRASEQTYKSLFVGDGARYSRDACCDPDVLRTQKICVPNPVPWSPRGGRVPARKLMERTNSPSKTYSDQRAGGMPSGRLREDGRVLFDVGEAFRTAPGNAAYKKKNEGSFNDPSFPCRGWQISQGRESEGEAPSTS